MKVLKLISLAVLGLLVILVFVAPVGPLPGVFIGGTPTQAPDPWMDTSSTHEILLRVPGTPPRVVTVWVVEHEGELNIVGSPGSGWVTTLGGGGAVEMRLGDNTYSLNASRVSQGWQPILTAYLDKYRPDYPDIISGIEQDGGDGGEPAVYRLNRS